MVQRADTEIAKRARTEGGEIHWSDETALVNTDVRERGFAPKEKAPVAYPLGTLWRLSMIAAVTNKGSARWQIIDGNFDDAGEQSGTRRFLTSKTRA